jgi:ubiquinone/menaquinone biosynthesis C-methylase UbiE
MWLRSGLFVALITGYFHQSRMQPQDYAYLYELEENFWWFAGMREITQALLDQIKPVTGSGRVLDAGCGTGGMMSRLNRYAPGKNVVGIDYSETALRFCVQRQQQLLARASVSELPFADASFDLVTSFDVLQHVPDQKDAQAIGEFYRVLRPGGIVFIRVAAYQWMRSGHDDAIAVQRRYDLDELAGHLRRAGFVIRKASYANTLLFPVAAVKRLIFTPKGRADAESEVKPWPKSLAWMNGLLSVPLKLEALALKKVDLPFGLSAICIGEKPRSDS